MSVSLRGDLKDFGIPEIFQLIGQQRKTGVLEFTRPGERVQIVFERGAVVRAEPVGEVPEGAFAEWLVRCGVLPREAADELLSECRRSAQSVQGLCRAEGLANPDELLEVRALLTRETVFSVLAWSSGHFDFQAREVEEGGAGHEPLAAEQILMDGLRILDESHRFEDAVPNRDLVFRAVGSLAGVRQQLPGEPGAERVFLLIDGRASAQRVIDLARLGSFEGTRLLAELARSGLIEATGVRAERRSARLAGHASGTRAPLQLLPTWLPIALLLATLGLAHGRVERQRMPRPGGVQWSAAERIRQGLELRRVRHAAEACRLALGRYPSRLAELAAQGCLPGGGLAGAERAPYYYEVRDGEMLLLAPAHSPD